jgi:hypothetical protein
MILAIVDGAVNFEKYVFSRTWSASYTRVLRFLQLNLSAKSCANPHMVNVGFHDPDVGNNPPPVT